MDGTINKIKINYSNNLKAKEYYAQVHKELKIAGELFEFNLKFIYDVLQSGRFKGSKMLEIGSGATVHYVATASKYFTNIVQSDFVEDNRKELLKWLKGDPNCLDWTELLNIVAQVEGLGNNLGENARILQSRIRRSVKAVIKSDVLSDLVIPLDELHLEISPPYDLITSVWCLENVAPDFETYVAILKKINTLLRPGGGIIIAGFENGGKWYVGSKVFHYLTISLEDIAEALNKSGFIKQEFRVLRKLEIDFGYQYDNVFCLAAEKA